MDEQQSTAPEFVCPACGEVMPGPDMLCSGSFTDTNHPSNVRPRLRGETSWPSRADVLSRLLDFAFDELFWISEAPNRNEVDGVALELAERARDALIRIEREDPDKEWTGP